MEIKDGVFDFPERALYLSFYDIFTAINFTTLDVAHYAPPRILLFYWVIFMLSYGQIMGDVKKSTQKRLNSLVDGVARWEPPESERHFRRLELSEFIELISNDFIHDLQKLAKKESTLLHTIVLIEFLTADGSCTTKYFWKKTKKKFVVHFFMLLLAHFTSKLVNYSRHSALRL